MRTRTALILILLGISAGAAAETSLSEIVVKGVLGETNHIFEANAVNSAVHSEKALEAYKGTPLTIELWCKLNSAKEFNILLSNETKASQTCWILYTDWKTGNLGFYRPSFDPQDLKTSMNIVDGKWHYVAMVHDGQTETLYVDAKEVRKLTVSKSSKPGAVVPGPLVVGQLFTDNNNAFNEQYCDGSIAGVRISNCARVISEVPHEPLRVDDHTVGLWNFDLRKGAADFADASPSHNPMKYGYPGESLSDLDRASFKAGPSPRDSKAETVSLRRGAVDLPPLWPAFPLEGDWQMVEGGTDAERLSGPWANAIKAPVPGSVHTALYQAGIIPHPYLGRNQETTKPWSFKTYYYKKTFPRPPKGRDETLVFDGICNRCTIWLNDKELGRHEGMFTKISYPINDLLKDENTLVVKLDPSVPAENGQGWRKTVVFNNSFGWMYSMFPPLGIWRPVSIQGEPAVKMRSPFVAARSANGGVMDLTTTISGAVKGWAGKLVGDISPDNFKGETMSFAQDVESASASKDVHLTFTISHPKLWWPVDMGDPNLYKLHLSFIPKGGGRADVQEMTFGLRTIETAPVNGKPSTKQLNWTFVINGEPMFVKGAGWCTPDAMMDFSRARYERFISLAASQHIQMFRAWGSGMVETEDFYDLCDRKGIMVLQEWPTAWNSHGQQPFDLLEQTVREGILRLRNHPSLAMYGGGNESDRPFGPAIDMMGRLSIELDGTRDFHRGEPYGGSSHDYAVCCSQGEDIDHAFTMQTLFLGEFGVNAYPCYESVQRFLPNDEKKLWPPKPDGSFAFHTPKWNTLKDLAVLTRLSQHFTSGTTMEQFIVGSQLAQAIGVRHALERARTRWPESTGAVYYKLNDNSPSATWATADWYGVPKIGHYLIKESFSPLVAVVLFPQATSYGIPLSLPVHLLDDADALQGLSWEVVVWAYGADLKQIKEARFAGHGSIAKVKPLGEFALDATQTKTAPLLMVMDVLKKGVLVQRNYNFTNFEPVKDCLFNLPRTSVTMTVKGDTLVVKNTGNLPAVGVNVGRPGHLDTFFAEDNYFWLDAGESKTVKVSDTNGVVVNGWNMETSNILR